MTKTIEALHTLIDNAILEEASSKSSRDYMGASGLGAECDRQLWYSFHQPKPVDSARALRIFKVGHALEPVIIEWLKKAGLQVWTEMPNGEQFGFTDGVIAGHIDGVVKGIPGDEDTAYLLEIKTANNFRYKAFVKDGFCSDEKYRTQVHVYMNKMKLKKCLAVVLNKDTEEIYFEIIDLDEFTAESSLQRGHLIAEMKDMPERKYQSKGWFKCQYCNFKQECWNG